MSFSKTAAEIGATSATSQDAAGAETLEGRCTDEDGCTDEDDCSSAVAGTAPQGATQPLQLSFWLKAFFGIHSPGQLATLVPGTLLAVALTLIAFPISDLLGQWILTLQGVDPAGKGTPISGVLIAILIGLALRNTIGLAPSLAPGVRFSITKLLRLGIIMVGIKLSLLDVLKLGGWGLPVVVTAIASGIVLITWFSNLLHLPGRLGTLIAAGTSICGITAILSTAPIIKAKEREVAYAVANVAIFGLLAMTAYPYLAHALLSTPEQVGLFLGTAVHDTTQVMGAAMMYKEVFHDDKALQVATVTKLTRNLLMVVVLPLLSIYYVKKQDRTQSKTQRVDLKKVFPVFVAGFVAAALARSIGDATLKNGMAFGLFSPSTWKWLTSEIGDVIGARYLLGTAMAAVGLNTSFSVFKGMGLKPFFVGMAGSLLVGAVGLGMAFLLGPFVKL